jgi:type IV pilus assembly protein PilC
MPDFHYQALNAQQQLVIGDLHAESVGDAIHKLEAQGLTVQSIGYASADAARSRVASTDPSSGPVTASGPTLLEPSIEEAALRTHMAVVLERGKSIVPALQALAAELPENRRRRPLLAVVRILERGNAEEATAALRRLPEYWIPLLSAATASQDAGRVLRTFLDESQRAEELRRQWWQALAYPLLILALAATVLIVLCLLVVPMFRNMFTDMALALPPPTVWLLRIAEEIATGRILLYLGGIALVIFLAPQVAKLLAPAMRNWFGDRFGTPLGRSAALARFARFSADLLEAGLNVPDSLRVAGFTTSSARLQRAAWRVARDVEREGGQSPLTRPELLTHTVLHVLRSPLPPEVRIRLLREVSDCYADRASHWVSWTRGMVEPVAIAAVGIVVGGVVLAIFLPLIYLIHNLSGGPVGSWW